MPLINKILIGISVLFDLIGFGLMLITPVLLLLFIILWILKKRKMLVGISWAILSACILPCCLLGVFIHPGTYCDHEWVLTSEEPVLCEQNGYKNYQCPLCTYTQSETIEKLGHDMVEISHKEPTIESEGKTVKGCTRCGEQEIVVLDKLPTSEMVALLMRIGYSGDHAIEIENVLNMVGITSIEIDNMTGDAEYGLNAMVCYPNGSKDASSRFTVTTENGVVFYVGFLSEDLYDSSKGGFLKRYSDVHIPETNVSSEAEVILMMMAEDVAKQIANYPSTVSFKTFEWGFWRKDLIYAVQGTFSCSNAYGVRAEHIIKLICEASEDNSKIYVKEVYLDGELVKTAE